VLAGAFVLSRALEGLDDERRASRQVAPACVASTLVFAAAIATGVFLPPRLGLPLARAFCLAESSSSLALLWGFPPSGCSARQVRISAPGCRRRS